MTRDECSGSASGFRATSFLVATLGLLFLPAGLACSNASIVPGGGQGGAGGRAPTGGAGGGNVTVTWTSSTSHPDAAMGSDAPRTCNPDSGDKCYAVIDAGPYCGDGIVQGGRGETCDDGNRIGGDGCSGTCQIEPNYICPVAGQPCVSTVACGNGKREPGESCDDNNTKSSDGCSSKCSVETGYTCPAEGEPCQQLVTCGDGRLQSGEECDLGGDNGAGKGCDAHCALQPGWTCKGHTCQFVPVCGDGEVTGGEECDEGAKPSGTNCCTNCKVMASYCTCPPSGGGCQDNSRCGNGVLEKEELCDDGNNQDGDGCTAKCQIETGWQCRMAGKPCNPLCGDGKILQGEQCDDGNADTGDGCSSICQIEPGASCAGTPSVCTKAICGNKKVEAGESCDDGNSVPFDGCSPTCQSDPKCGTSTSAVGACQTACGDGIQVRGVEECDDGNVLDHDGCSRDCKIEPGNTCRSGYDNPPEKLELPIVARDFKGAEHGDAASPHPDFGTYCCDDTLTKSAGVLRSTLDASRKPVWAGPDPVPDPKQLLFTGRAAFDQWYRDVTNVNMTYYETLTLLQDPANKTTYAMNSDTDQPWYDLCGFFPLDDLSKPKIDQNTGQPVTYTETRNNEPYTCHAYDGLGFGNSWANHNFSFTTELRYWFQYQGGENLTFTGDDDVWVFVNGTLGVDLGGVHNRAIANVVLNATNGTGQVSYPNSQKPSASIDFKLEIGKVYEVVVFQAERWCCGSNYMLTLANFLAGRSQCGPTCGDGTIAGTEECDDGPDNSDTRYGGCTTLCRFGPFCGDGEVNGEEECDDGRNTTVGYNVSGCGPGCKLPPRCGDGVQQIGEECDAGASNKDAQCGGGCSAKCQLNPSCGDAQVDAACGEECDDGLNTGGYGFCATSCTLGPRCGDGVVQSQQGEECDLGAKNADTAGSACTTSCQKPGFCGDGILQAERGETCDDGKNDGSCGGCTPDCQHGPYCGDGVLQKECDEVCDYGGLNTLPSNAAYGGCLTNCELGPHCGDGILQSPDEECDLGAGNGGPTSECSANCIRQVIIP
jgi:fibro-slime domain-containing protein